MYVIYIYIYIFYHTYDIYIYILYIYIGFCPTFRKTHLDQVHQYIPSLKKGASVFQLYSLAWGFQLFHWRYFTTVFSGPWMHHRKIIAWYPWKQSQLQPLHGGFLNWWYLQIIQVIRQWLSIETTMVTWRFEIPRFFCSLPKKPIGQLHPAPVPPVPSGQMGGIRVCWQANIMSQEAAVMPEMLSIRTGLPRAVSHTKIIHKSWVQVSSLSSLSSLSSFPSPRKFEVYVWLVVLTILKNMKVNFVRIIPYIIWYYMENIKFIFETTKQIYDLGIPQTDWDDWLYQISPVFCGS